MASLSSYTTATSATIDNIWTYWNTQYDGTATATPSYSATATSTVSATVWLLWNGQYWQTQIGVSTEAANRLTTDELREMARQQRELEDRRIREAAECRRLAEQAEARAELLLKANLQADQLQEFEKSRTFTVISKDGQRRYRIHKGSAGNIRQIDKEGKPVLKLCAHASGRFPDFDHMLMQKLWLEHDEEGFLQIANKTA